MENIIHQTRHTIAQGKPQNIIHQTRHTIAQGKPFVVSSLLIWPAHGMVIYYTFSINNQHLIIFSQWVDSTSMIYPHIVYEELSKAETLNQVAATDDVDNCTIEGLSQRF
jgi:hypothetical protein